MNARNLTVEQALSATESHVTVADLSAQTGLAAEAVKEELKRLADAGNLSHIPAGRGKAARYALLTNPPGSDSEGGEPDIAREMPPPAPYYDLRVASLNESARAAAELANARALVVKLERLLESKTHECEALRASAHYTTPMGTTGYLLRVAKRKPRVLLKKGKAQAAALSAAKSAGRAEVFALVPIGSAVRGSEWRDA